MKKFLIIFISLLTIFTGCEKSADIGGKHDDEAPLQTSVAPEPTPLKQEDVKIDITNLSNKKSGWGFRKIAGERPEFTKEQISSMESFGCIYMGEESEKTLYLTFDEGYENGYTAVILDTLKKHGVRAAFFITEPYLSKSGDLVDRMVNEGHIVGNHTVNHPSLPDKTNEEIEKEVLSLNESVFKKYNIVMTYLRPPMGEYSDKSLAITKNLGFTNVFWSFAYRDWEIDNQKGTDYAFEQVTKGLHNGAVILLHAVSKDNAAALDRIITYALQMGYEFKSLDEYK